MDGAGACGAFGHGMSCPCWGKCNAEQNDIAICRGFRIETYCCVGTGRNACATERQKRRQDAGATREKAARQRRRPEASGTNVKVKSAGETPAVREATNTGRSRARALTA